MRIATAATILLAATCLSAQDQRVTISLNNVPRNQVLTLEVGSGSDAYIAYATKALRELGGRNYRDAVFDFTKAIELNPDSAAAYFNRSIAERKLDDISGSLQDIANYFYVKLGFHAVSLIPSCPIRVIGNR